MGRKGEEWDGRALQGRLVKTAVGVKDRHLLWDRAAGGGF